MVLFYVKLFPDASGQIDPHSTIYIVIWSLWAQNDHLHRFLSKIRPNLQSESIDGWVLASKFNIKLLSDIRTNALIE